MEFDAAIELSSCVDEAFVRERILLRRCVDGPCHGRRNPQANLDLQREGAGDRMMGVTSIHEACADRELVVPGQARASFLMDKVLGLQGSCGDLMPPTGGMLSLEERRCLVTWIDSMEF